MTDIRKRFKRSITTRPFSACCYVTIAAVSGWWCYKLSALGTRELPVADALILAALVVLPWPFFIVGRIVEPIGEGVKGGRD